MIDMFSLLLTHTLLMLGAWRFLKMRDGEGGAGSAVPDHRPTMPNDADA